jgi:hypothetical protein
MRLDVAQRHWERAISAFAWKVNAAAWLDRASPGFFAVGVSAGFGAYALRRSRGEDWALWWTACALAFIGVSFWAWWRARGSFFRARDARALLEHRLGLNSALSAASGGVARWPTPRALPAVLRWRAPATLGWLAGALGLVLAGLVLPLPSRPAAEYRRGAEKPPALAEAEAWLEQLAAKEVARPEDVERLAEMARGLGERTPEERYSHSVLEAADTLRAQTAQAIRGLGASLEEAAQALSPLERPGQLSDEELGAVAARLGEALRGLREGPLAAREEMARELANAAKAAGSRSLSPEQAARLRQQLAKSGRAATGVLGAQGQGASIAAADPDAPMRSGPGEGFGSGDITRGPGHAPMMFRDEASEAGGGRTETVGGDDLSRAALGDLLAMERGEHEFDPKRAAASSAAGAIASPAQGGEVVWVDRLSPGERAALKDFFK